MATLTLTQVLCQTAKTKTGNRNMLNKKPFRSGKLKAAAKSECIRTEGGSFRSTVMRQKNN